MKKINVNLKKEIENYNTEDESVKEFAFKLLNMINEQRDERGIKETIEREINIKFDNKE